MIFLKIIINLKNNLSSTTLIRKKKDKDETGFKRNVKNLTTYSLSKYILQQSIRFCLHVRFLNFFTVNSVYL